MDRNLVETLGMTEEEVALHPEGVDRNSGDVLTTEPRRLSPSTRRAWIEMPVCMRFGVEPYVALHPEGVDRNRHPRGLRQTAQQVALHPEGVDRNPDGGQWHLRLCRRRPPPGGRG